MTALELAVGALAIYRISSLLVAERGPWNVFTKIRERMGIEHRDGYPVAGKQDTYWTRLFACLWCMSVQVAIGWVIGYALAKEIVMLVSFPFALSAGAIIVERWINGSS